MTAVKVLGGVLEVSGLGTGQPEHPIAPGGGDEPVDPGYGIPLPPVISHPIELLETIWPSPGRPAHPIVRPPTYPVDPGWGLPTLPGKWPIPPRPVDPQYGIPECPLEPGHPIYPVPPVAGQLPVLPPGSVYPPLPPGVTGQLLCFVWIVGVGYRWIVIDTNLKPTHPIAPPPLTPEHPIELPGTPQPKPAGR